MPLDTLLSANRVHCHADCTSKKRALETLADLIASSVQTVNADELFQQLISRERLGSTGLGQGIAIPHCRFTCEGGSVCAVVTLINPIDFDAVDGKPVDVLFAMLVPEDADDSHLKNLAALAEAFQTADYADSLRQAATNQELFEAALKPFNS